MDSNVDLLRAVLQFTARFLIYLILPFIVVVLFITMHELITTLRAAFQFVKAAIGVEL